MGGKVAGARSVNITLQVGKLSGRKVEPLLHGHTEDLKLDEQTHFSFP